MLFHAVGFVFAIISRDEQAYAKERYGLSLNVVQTGNQPSLGYICGRGSLTRALTSKPTSCLQQSTTLCVKHWYVPDFLR